MYDMARLSNKYQRWKNKRKLGVCGKNHIKDAEILLDKMVCGWQLMLHIKPLNLIQRHSAQHPDLKAKFSKEIRVHFKK